MISPFLFLLSILFSLCKTTYLTLFSPICRTTSPYLTLPYLTSPHLPSPYLTSPPLTSPHLTSPHLTSPHLTSPRLTSPRLTTTLLFHFPSIFFYLALACESYTSCGSCLHAGEECIWCDQVSCMDQSSSFSCQKFEDSSCIYDRNTISPLSSPLFSFPLPNLLPSSSSPLL